MQPSQSMVREHELPHTPICCCSGWSEVALNYFKGKKVILSFINSVVLYSIINRPASIPFMLPCPPAKKKTKQQTKRESHIMIIPGYFKKRIILILCGNPWKCIILKFHYCTCTRPFGLFIFSTAHSSVSPWLVQWQVHMWWVCCWSLSIRIYLSSPKECRAQNIFLLSYTGTLQLHLVLPADCCINANQLESNYTPQGQQQRPAPTVCGCL